jgi:hypothetical protein
MLTGSMRRSERWLSSRAFRRFLPVFRANDDAPRRTKILLHAFVVSLRFELGVPVEQVKRAA